MVAVVIAGTRRHRAAGKWRADGRETDIHVIGKPAGLYLAEIERIEVPGFAPGDSVWADTDASIGSGGNMSPNVGIAAGHRIGEAGIAGNVAIVLRLSGIVETERAVKWVHGIKAVRV